MKRNITVLCALVVFFININPSWAALPAPPSGTTSQVYYGAGGEMADIYIWNDVSGNAYVHVVPNSLGIQMGSAMESYYLASQNRWIALSAYDENHEAYQFKKLTTPTTFYLLPTTYTDPMFDVTSTTQIKFYNFPGIYAYYYYPNDFFSGTPTPVPCNCPDTDNDGVPDAWDNCPNTPANSVVDNHGCPQSNSNKVVVVPLLGN